MPHLRRLATLIDRTSAALGRAVSWLVLLMVLVAALNAVGRYAGRYVGMNLSSNAWLELQWYLFSLVFLLGGADALRRNAHVRVDVLYGSLSPRTQQWIDLVGSMVFLLPFCVFALVVSAPSVAASWAVWEASPDPGGLPRWPIKSAILVGFGLLFLQGVAQVIHTVDALRSQETA